MHTKFVKPFLIFFNAFQKSTTASRVCLSACQLEGARTLLHYRAEANRIYGLQRFVGRPSGKI